MSTATERRAAALALEQMAKRAEAHCLDSDLPAYERDIANVVRQIANAAFDTLPRLSPEPETKPLPVPSEYERGFQHALADIETTLHHLGAAPVPDDIFGAEGDYQLGFCSARDGVFARIANLRAGQCVKLPEPAPTKLCSMYQLATASWCALESDHDGACRYTRPKLATPEPAKEAGMLWRAWNECGFCFESVDEPRLTGGILFWPGLDGPTNVYGKTANGAAGVNGRDNEHHSRIEYIGPGPDPTDPVHSARAQGEDDGDTSSGGSLGDQEVIRIPAAMAVGTGVRPREIRRVVASASASDGAVSDLQTAVTEPAPAMAEAEVACDPVRRGEGTARLLHHARAEADLLRSDVELSRLRRGDIAASLITLAAIVEQERLSAPPAPPAHEALPPEAKPVALWRRWPSGAMSVVQVTAPEWVGQGHIPVVLASDYTALRTAAEALAAENARLREQQSSFTAAPTASREADATWTLERTSRRVIILSLTNHHGIEYTHNAPEFPTFDALLGSASSVRLGVRKLG